MDTLIGFWKKLRLDRVLAVCLASAVLLFTVACSNGNAVGARPDNLPVQAGGQNNPHKAGGDGYTEYRMSTDPVVKDKQDRAERPNFNHLVAAVSDVNTRSLPGANSDDARKTEATTAREQVKDTLFNAKRIPELRQTEVDRGNPSVPNAKILSKVGASFKDASQHLTGSTDEAIEQGSPLADPSFGE